MEQFINAYGPYAFGLVSLMILWYTIVKPQVKIQETQSNTMRQTAEANKETATILREVTRELRTAVSDLRDMERARWQTLKQTTTTVTDSTGQVSDSSPNM